MWFLSEDGFDSIVEFDPPLTTIKQAVYSKDENGKTDYKTILEPAVRGTDRVCQAQIDQLVGYVSKADSPDGRSTHLLVRARIEEDLFPLKNYDPNAVFFEDKSADYQFRCIISRIALAMYVAHKVLSIDYNSHVKETVNRRAPQIPGGRMGALSSVWSAFAEWQPNAPYGATTGSMYGRSYGSADRDKDTKSWSATSGTVNSYYGTKFGSYTQGRDTSLDALSDDEWEKLYGHPDPEDHADDPGWTLTELDIRIASGGPTEETMREQIKELQSLDYSIASINLDAAVEAITDAFGTCDVSSLDEEAFYDVLDTINPDMVDVSKDGA